MDVQPTTSAIRTPAPCPVCNEPDGFHSAQTHAEVIIDPAHFKAKDWHKNADTRK